MVANYPSSGFEQSGQESVQHICCPPTTIREHAPKQAIDNVHVHPVSNGTM